jgi:hypothetical protein
VFSRHVVLKSLLSFYLNPEDSIGMFLRNIGTDLHRTVWSRDPVEHDTNTNCVCPCFV